MADLFNKLPDQFEEPLDLVVGALLLLITLIPLLSVLYVFYTLGRLLNAGFPSAFATGLFILSAVYLYTKWA